MENAYNKSHHVGNIHVDENVFRFNTVDKNLQEKLVSLFQEHIGVKTLAAKTSIKLEIDLSNVSVVEIEKTACGLDFKITFEDIISRISVA